MSEELDQGYRRIVNAGCMYDWGISALSATGEAVLRAHFHQVVAARLVGTTASIFRGYTNAVTLPITVLLAPILGRSADCAGGGKKRPPTAFAGLGILATVLRVCLGAGEWALALVLFMLGSIGLGARVLYDALPLHIARSEHIDYVSSRGYALGYLGGGMLVAVNVLMIPMHLEGSTWGRCVSFLTVAI